MRKKLMSVLLALAMVLTLLPATAMAGEQTTIYVNATAGGDTATGTEEAPYKTLQAAINAASEGATIVLQSDLTVGSTASVNSAAIIIDKALTLEGNGHKIIAGSFANGAHVVGVHSAAGAVTIQNLTIVGATGAKHCLNVYQCADTVTLNNVTLKDSATAGLVINGSTVVANGLTTSDNAWGAVNVDKRSSFTLTGASSLAEKAQIWTEDSSTITAAGYTAVTGGLAEDKVLKGFTYYTTDPAKLGAAQIGNHVYISLAQAISDVTDTAEIKLLKSSDEQLPSISGKAITLSLGGNTLRLNSADSVVLSDGASLTINNGSIVAKGFTNGTNSLFNIQKDSAITLNGVAVDTTASALYPQGDAASVTVIRSTINCGVYAVGTNAATVENYNVVITLKDSTFTSTYGYTTAYSKDSCPVMINVPGTLNMDNCVVNGTRQGVLVRGGTAIITNSTIKTTGEYTDGIGLYLNGDWGSGDEVPMAALVVGNRASAYAYPATCTVTNTTITSESSQVPAIYTYGMNADSRKATLSIGGVGTAVSGEISNNGEAALTITGGTFSADPTQFLADGYKVREVNGAYSVVPENSFIITFDSKGGTAVDPVATNAEGKLTTLPVPVLSGYVFSGWYTEAGVQVTADTEFTADTTVYAQWTYVPPYTPPTSGSTGTTGGSQTVTNPDGSTTTTVTKPDGTVTVTDKDTQGNVTETVSKPDGTSTTTVTNTNGSSSVTTVGQTGKVEAQVSLSQSAVAAAGSEAVALPMAAVPVSYSQAAAPVVTVDLPAGTASAKVEVPVTNATAGTVAILVKADGTQEIVKTSVTTADSVTLTVEDGAKVMIVDNSKDFADVPASYWGSDAVDFATSRDLFNGTSATTFAPDAEMNRAMIVTVLARLDGVDTSAGSSWYETGRQWAIDAGISDGSDMDQNLTREQLATMLYRYAGSPAVSGAMTGFADTASVSTWASDAMTWAVSLGIINGMDGSLNPQGEATRAQVATMLMRFVATL